MVRVSDNNSPDVALLLLMKDFDVQFRRARSLLRVKVLWWGDPRRPSFVTDPPFRRVGHSGIGSSFLAAKSAICVVVEILTKPEIEVSAKINHWPQLTSVSIDYFSRAPAPKRS